jgi:hypothetical protein
MKIFSLLAAIMFFISEVFSRKIHKHKNKKLCEHGDKVKGQYCTLKLPCGSECSEGLKCEETKCVVLEGLPCEDSHDCVEGLYCKRAGLLCTKIPKGYARREIDFEEYMEANHIKH